LTKLRQNEIRDKVQAYFKAQLDQYSDWLDRHGLSKNALEDIQCEMLDHEDHLNVERDTNQYLPIKPFLRKSGLSVQDWRDSHPMMQRELRKGRRDLLSRIVEAAERLEHYSYDDAPEITGPVAELCRSFNRILCTKGEYLWERSKRQNSDRKLCVLR
jgi:hypothetical protein